MFKRFLLPVMFFSLLGCVGGCLVVNSKPPPSQTYVAPAPAQAQSADAQTMNQLRQENAQLRAQRDKLEQDSRQWQSAVDARQQELNDLKAQRDQIKKERDRYKKALGD